MAIFNSNTYVKLPEGRWIINTERYTKICGPWPMPIWIACTPWLILAQESRQNISAGRVTASFQFEFASRALLDALVAVLGVFHTRNLRVPSTVPSHDVSRPILVNQALSYVQLLTIITPWLPIIQITQNNYGRSLDTLTKKKNLGNLCGFVHCLGNAIKRGIWESPIYIIIEI